MPRSKQKPGKENHSRDAVLLRMLKSPPKPLRWGLVADAASGAGWLVIPRQHVHALRKGESIAHAWSNVGGHLNDSFAKLEREREEARTE